MIPLSGNTVDDVMMTVACGNCDESVPIPSSLVKEHMRRVKSQRLQLGLDNHCFITHKIMLDDKLELQRIDLEFMFKALKETRDSDKYEELSRQYVKGKSRYLSLIHEAIYMQKIRSEMVEDSTVDCSDTVRRHIKTCDRYDKDLKDIRQTLDYLRKENENFKRVQKAATNLSKQLACRFSAVHQYSIPNQSSITARSSPDRHQHPKSKRFSVTEQSITLQQSSNLKQSSIIGKPMTRKQSLREDHSTITSRSSVINRLSRLNRSLNADLSADVNNSQEYLFWKRVSSRMNDSSSTTAQAMSTRNLSFTYRAPRDNNESNANRPQPSPLVQELPVDLDIEDSELLFES